MKIMRFRGYSSLCIVAAVAACGGSEHSAVQPVSQDRATAIAAPSVLHGVNRRGMWQILSVSPPADAEGIVRANGAFWVANYAGASLARFTFSGKQKTFRVNYDPQEITADRDGKLWFTNARLPSEILRFDPRTSKLTAVDLTDETDGGITLGADGNIWVAENSHIGKVTPAGHVTEYPTPYTAGGTGLTWADGKVWFLGGKGIASLDPRNGGVESYGAPIYDAGGVVASDGSVFTISASVVIQFDPKTTSVTTYDGPSRFGASPTPGDLAVAPDGSLWYAVQRIGRHAKKVIGGGFVRFDPKSKHFRSFASPNRTDWNWDVAVAPDGKVWGTAGYAVTVLDVR